MRSLRALAPEAWLSFPELDAGRVRLRRIVAADASALFAIHGDAERMRWYGASPLASERDAVTLVRSFAAERHRPDPGIRWAIERKDQPGLIGTCGFFDVQRARGTCLIGYEIAGHAQGHGYMREALQCAIAWAWDGLEVHRIEAQVHPENRRSLAVLDKLGFVVEGTQRGVGFRGGRFHDMLLLSLLRGA